MTRKTGLCATALAGLWLLPAGARAEGTTCANPTILVADGRIVESSIPNAMTFQFFAGATIGRSYSVEARYHTGDYTSALVLTVSPAACGTSTVTNLTGTKTVEPLLRCSTCTDPGAAQRFSFRTSADFVRLSVQNTSGTGQPYSITISETSLYSPAWSTNGNFDTYYSLYNTTSTTVTGTLTLYNNAGMTVSTVLVTIPAFGTTSTNTIAAATSRNTTGTAVFVHNAPPGAVLGEAAIASFSITPPYIQIVKFATARESAH